MKNNRKEEIKFIKCDLCGNDNTVDYLFFPDFKYVQCVNCGLIYQNPQPHFKQLKDRYAKKYFQYEIRNQNNFFNLMKLTLNDIHFFEKIAPQFNENTRSFLDIGCATGLLLNYIRGHHWQVSGVELGTYSVTYARKRFNLPIINESLENARLPINHFEVVHWSHVIEHLISPTIGLQKIYSVLKPSGYMLLTTPRVDSFQQWVFKSKWRSFHRDHLFIFSKVTLTKLVEKAGFKIIDFFSWGGIAAGLAPKPVKYIIDKSAKQFNFGDVMFILAQK